METTHAKQKKNILVIEDEKPLSDAIKLKLEQRGISVKTVPLAEEGLDIIKKEAVDLVWLDLRLPKMSGIEFLETLKNNPQKKKWNIVVVSNSGSFDTKEQALALGASDYLVKSEMRLEDVISKVIMDMDHGKH